MQPTTLPVLCLVTLVLCNVHGSLEHEIPKRSFLSRRAIDGTRGRKFFDPEEEGAFDSYGSAGGQYDPYEEKTDLSDIRRNVPGEPGADYPAYTTLPQTGFTCEERSRGYYADEVAGCQVFHVCHDVLVSSFLCPIGSIFSQKLLTCDWWTKVDCSASSKYIDVNRDSYQQDDDEMIRKAYAMISLQSGTDVTKDGLVDPDRTGSIVDYQKGPGRILDYSQVDTTGNDLRTSFDYSAPASRDFFSPSYQLKGTRKPEASRSYQDKFYSSDKSGSPYQDSPIIRIQKINDPEFGGQRNKDFQNAYRRPNEFTNQFQPSYAPTVPTVTTTTRRFYSPTVPTMFRSSTLAYNKLDQVIDSSDYYFSRGRTNSFVTPPTRVFASQDKDFAEKDSRKSSRDDEYVKQESYDYDYENTDSEEKTRDERPSERFQVRVLDDFNDLNRTKVARVGGSPLFEEVYGRFRDRNRDQDNFDSADDFEVRGSIGLGQALHQSYRGISVRQQNPVKIRVETKIRDEFNSRGGEVRHTLAKPESEEKKEETTEQYQKDDEETNNSNRFLSTTTPSVIESTIKASTSSRESSISVNSSVANSEYSNENEKGSIDVGDFQASRSAEFLEPPLERTQSKFQIKVPDLFDESTLLIHYTAQHDAPYSSSTTELPSFEGADSDDYIDQPTSLDGIATIMTNYRGTEIPEDSSFQNHPGAVTSTLVSSTGSWFSSSPRDRSNARIPAKDHSTGKAEGDTHLKLENDTENKEKIGRIKLEFSEDNVQSSKERSTRQFNKTSPFSAAESIDVESSVADEVKKTSDESKDNKGATESSRALLRSSRPETLRHIEESIDRNNSPYQVTLTMNRNEELVPTGRDIISKLIARQGKETSSFSDEIHELEIIKSVEPEIRRTTESDTTTANISDVKKSVLETNDTTDVDLTDTKKNSPNIVSLLQLMSELLKLDRVPRPFSLSDAQSSRSNARSQSPSVASLGTIAKDVNSNAEFGQDEATIPSQETTSTELNSETSATRSKEKILGQLEENFGEPLYREGKRSSLELPEKERSVEFQAEVSLESANEHEEKANASSKVDVESTATTTANVTSTTKSEKTVVKTEFVPSIGFSLDTDEGREEYVEAILGGLIEPQTVESVKEETVLEEKSEKEAFSRKNETTRSVSGKI